MYVAFRMQRCATATQRIAVADKINVSVCFKQVQPLLLLSCRKQFSIEHSDVGDMRHITRAACAHLIVRAHSDLGAL